MIAEQPEQLEGIRDAASLGADVGAAADSADAHAFCIACPVNECSACPMGICLL